MKKMNIQEILLSKNGMAIVKIAEILLSAEIGEKIPTVAELTKSTGLANGTVHHALKILTETHAVNIVSKGHMGSYLMGKDYKLLLDIAGIKYLIGAMPLPYTKRYEGLASGLISAMENGYNIPVNLSYMRGAKNRISMVIYERYDFAIVSKLAAEEYLKDHDDISVVLSFGPLTYTSNHAIMFHDENSKFIEDGMTVGIDRSSIDQVMLLKKECDGKKVKFVEIEYSHIIEHVIKGDIDATVMNIDEVNDRGLRINYTPLVKEEDDSNTTAVMVVKSKNKEIGELLKKIIDPKTVLQIQKQVLEGKIQPSY